MDQDKQTQSSGFRSGYVAMIGPPNAGKSTLLNAFVGQKVSIVSPKPQTTRNRISGILTEKDFQAIFLDTPGLLDKRGLMQKIMREEAWQSLAMTDLILTVFDADLSIRRPDLLKADLNLLGQTMGASKKPLFVALNKVDLFRDKHPLLPVLEHVHQVWPEARLFPVSAKSGRGLDELRDDIVASLPEGPAIFPEDQISTAPLRFMAAEIIREKLFLSLRQELPYSVAVAIELWNEGPEPEPLHISAVIYVSRRSHKGMIIGRHGQMLKDTGTAARKDIEALAGRKVFLELWVKVREDWTEDQVFLRSLSAMSEDGLELPY